jgi:hypothetical protein
MDPVFVEQSEKADSASQLGADPGETDAPGYWESNEYQALRERFAGPAAPASFEEARGDPESWERYRKDRARYLQLLEKFKQTAPT